MVIKFLIVYQLFDMSLCALLNCADTISRRNNIGKAQKKLNIIHPLRGSFC
jgi:hypothetical protein